MDIKFLKKLSNADALAAEEDEVRNLLLDYNTPYSDDVFCDNLGSIVFKKYGTDKNLKIMIAAHMDEVGFKVRSIEKGGQIVVKTIGGVKPNAKYMQKVRITTKNGKKYKGYLQSVSNNNEMEITTYVDLGLNNDEEVHKLGIKIGDIVSFDTNFEHLSSKNLIIGKAFDDRIGCFIMAEVLKKIKDKHPNTLFFAGTSSEEVGTRGAQTTSNMIKPDMAIVIDTCCYKNEFDRTSKNCRQINKGMIVEYSDKRMESNRKLINYMLDIANINKSNIQHDMFDRGGTDAGIIHLHNCGVPVLNCNIPLRYGHCSSSIASINDINDAIKLICKFLQNFDKKMLYNCTHFI